MEKFFWSPEFFSALEEHLALCRSTSQHTIFESLGLLTANVLTGTVTSSNLAKLDTDADLRSSVLLNVVLFASDSDDQPRVWLSSWLRVVKMLIGHDERLLNAYHLAVVMEVTSGVSEFLQVVERLSQSEAPDNESLAEVIHKLASKTKPSARPERYKKGVLSRESFHAETRDAFAHYLRELSYLTVKQVEARECAFRHRRLWITGPAGSGKTILAVEIAYRHLRAGQKTLFVYRSTQFKHILLELLEPVASGLSLLSHAELVPILKATQHHGTDSKHFIELVSGLFPEVAEHTNPVWDLVIVDDSNQSDKNLRTLLSELEFISQRSIVLSATDQMYSAALTIDNNQSLTVEDFFDTDFQVDITPLKPLAGYFLVELESNLRNARQIASYVGRVTGHAVDSAVKASGYRETQHTTWDTISDDVVSLVKNALEVYDPGSIRIICDSHLYHPALLGAVIAELPSRQSELADQLDPLAGAILKAAGWCGLTGKTMDAESGTLQLDSTGDEGVVFAFCDGQTVMPIDYGNLQVPTRANSSDRSLDNLYHLRVDARGVLDPYALKDPFRWHSLIMIYDASLFIGLEADMVIYVRNRRDIWLESEGFADQKDMMQIITQARNEQHLVAMTRAKHHLVDLIIEDE